MKSEKPGVNPAPLSSRTGGTSGSRLTVPPGGDNAASDMPETATTGTAREVLSRFSFAVCVDCTDTPWWESPLAGDLAREHVAATGHTVDVTSTVAYRLAAVPDVDG